jgi:nitroreductase
MDVNQAIAARRAYRSLAPVPITEDLIHDLAAHAQLAPSCSNNQPWRFVFVDDPAKLVEMREVFTTTNAWAHSASMIVAVFSRREDDCIIREREYHLFGCGLAVGFLVLRATELGLVAHPIAGFSPKKTRAILGIPDAFQVTSLILVGMKAEALNPVMTPKQVIEETARPPRLPFERFAYRNTYTGPVPEPAAAPA